MNAAMRGCRRNAIDDGPRPNSAADNIAIITQIKTDQKKKKNTKN